MRILDLWFDAIARVLCKEFQWCIYQHARFRYIRLLRRHSHAVTPSMQREFSLTKSGAIVNKIEVTHNYCTRAAPGKKTEVEPFNGGPHQQWAFEGKRIVNRSNGEVLDVYGEHGHDGATVGSYRWKDSANQHWRLEYVWEVWEDMMDMMDRA